MTQNDIKDIKLGNTDAMAMFCCDYMVWPVLPEDQTEWPLIRFSNTSTTDYARVQIRINSVLKDDDYVDPNLNIEFSLNGVYWRKLNYNTVYTIWIAPNVKNLKTEASDFYWNIVYSKYFYCRNLYVRGANNTSVQGLNIGIWHGDSDSPYSEIHCMGNIMSLLDYNTLPTEITTEYCFSRVFHTMNSIYVDTISPLKTAPKLPATNLTKGCYEGLFMNCTSLLEAPELPVNILVDECYKNMFKNCWSLNYVKMMATDISATDCLTDWMYKVPATGTFVKNKDATWLNEDANIPTGWTTQTE